MFRHTDFRFPLNAARPSPLLLLVAACLLCLAAVADAPAQTPSNNTNSAAATPAAKDEAAAEAPAFQEYKGVRIAMAADEVRRKLGSPTDKSDAQDFYLVSNKESVQVIYDGAKKVSAIAIIYMNAGASVPTPKAVIGADVEAKPDGSVYKLVRYPKAGYWVSYSRTAGDSPIVSVTMQKLN